MLVSNAGQGNDAQTSITGDHSQAFTVGVAGRPYIVYGVTMISEDAEGDDLALQICGADSSGNPTTTCTDLTAPDSSEAGSLYFTAQSDPVLALLSGANYAVVVKTPGGDNVALDSTESNSEDASSISGWSIRNRSKWKSGTNSWSENDDEEAIRITIHGKASLPPTLVAPTPVLADDGLTLTLTFSGSLMEASVPDKSAFTVNRTPSGANRVSVPLAAVDPVIVTGTTVTLKLATPIAHNDRLVRVSYQKPTSGTVIEGVVGNDLETFPDQDVTNNSTIPRVSVEAVYPDASSLIALPVLRATRSNTGTNKLRVTLDVTEADDYVELVQEDITIEAGNTTSEKTITLDYPGNTNGNLTYTLAPSQDYAPAISPGNAATVQIKAPASGVPITVRHAQTSWTVNEGDSITAMVTFTLAPGLAAPRDNLRIFLNGESEGAEPPDDYTGFHENAAEPYVDAVPGGWTAANGGGMTQTAAITTVTTIEDTEVESNEVFYLDFSQDNTQEALDIPLTESDVPNLRTTVSILDNDPLVVTDVEVTSSPNGGYYGVGDTIEFTATFNTYMTLEEGPVQERPVLEFELGGATRQAEGQDSEEEMDVTFEYTVETGDSDDHDGISWGADTLSLNGGSIFASSKGVLIPRHPDLDHAAQGALSGHKVDTTKPSLVSASAIGTTLTLSYSEDLNTTAPANTQFTVKVQGGAPAGFNPTSVSVSGSEVTLTVGTAVTTGQTVTVTYAKPTMNPIKDLSGKEADAFTDQNVMTPPLVDVTVTFARNSYTAEEGATESLTVRLSDNPLRRVLIPIIATGQAGAGNADYTVPSEVVFISGDSIKTIDFAATDDNDNDDGESVQLEFGALPLGVSGGTHTQTTVSITDNDNPGVRVTPTSLTVREGRSSVYRVALNNPPTATVTVAVSSGHEDVTVDKDSLTFTTVDWSMEQTVTVSAAQDEDTADSQVTVRHTVTSGDPDYDGSNASAVRVTIDDDDGSSTPQSGGGSSGSGGGGGGGGGSRATPTPTPTPSPTPTATPTPTGPRFSGQTAADPRVTETVVPEGTTLGLNGGGDLPGGVYVNFPPTAVALPVSVSVSVSNEAPSDVTAPSGTTLLPLTIDITPETPLTLGTPLTMEINPTPEQLEAAGGDLNNLSVGVVTPNGIVVLPAQVLHGRLVITIDHLSTFVLLAVTDPGPVLTQPPMGDASSMGPLLQWTQPPRTTWFQVQVIPFNEDGPGINLVIGDSAQVRAAQYQVLGPNFGSADPNYVMLPGMTYLWRVRTTTVTTNPTEDDWSAWAVSSFKTPPASSSTITPVAPQVFGEVSTLTPTLTWANSNAAVFYYEVQVSKDYEFGPNAFLYSEYVHGGASTPLNSYVVPAAFPLEVGEIYYWRVRPRIQGDGDPLPWSATYVFLAPKE